MAEDDHIDELLAQYLQLLDTYTTLRTELSELQSSVYHSLARANFSAERGIRYGQDFYDERMQATKILTTDYSEDGLSTFSLCDLNATPPTDTTKAKTENESEDISKKLEQTTVESEEKNETSEPPAADTEPAEADGAEATKQTKSKNPLRWFGILIPPSLRQAQSSASKLVETAVKLSTVGAEMKGVEIEIRRARKRKTKVKSEKVVEIEKATGKVTQEEVHEQAKAEPAKVNRGEGCGRVAI